MSNGTFFCSIKLEIDFWDFWTNLRCLITKEDKIKLNQKITFLKGKTTYNPGNVFEIEYFQPVKNQFLSESFFNLKFTYECLSTTNDESKKLIVYQIKTSCFKYIICFDLRKINENLVLFLKISNIEAIKKTKECFDISQLLINDQNQTISSEETKTFPDNNQLKGSKTKIDSDKNDKDCLKNEFEEQSKSSKEEKYECNSQKNPTINNKNRSSNLKNFNDLGKGIISFERENLVKLADYITNNRTYVNFQGSKIFNVNFNELTKLLGNVELIVKILNSDGKVYDDNVTKDFVTITPCPDNNKVPQTIGNKYTIINHIYNFEIVLLLAAYDVNNFCSEISYSMELYGILQIYRYTVKKIDECICFVELNLSMKGPNLNALLKEQKVINMANVLIMLEKQLLKCK